MTSTTLSYFSSTLLTSTKTMAYSNNNNSIFFFLLLKYSITSLAHQLTSAPHLCTTSTSNNTQHCPPFNGTSLPYPFSTVPGCGHPAFFLYCGPTFSLLTINNLTFSLLSFDASSSSLLLSPHLPSHHSNSQLCPSHYSHIPHKPINLTNSPFKISDSACSRLSLLKPCASTNLSLPNCSHCPWHCSLFKHPSRLLESGCGDAGRPDPGAISEQGCHGDVLGFLDEELGFGIWVYFDESSDSYFSKCEDCNGVCGYNVSDSDKSFLCYSGVSTIGENTYTLSPWIELHKRRIKIISSIFLIVCSLLVIVLVYILVRNRRITEAMAAEDPTTLFLHRHRCASLLPPVFTYEELEASTNRFDPKRKIGDGGFGSVFLGQLFDGRIVAVKYLHRHHHAAKTVSNKSFCNEILILSSIEHPNLVKLHGYCSDPRGLLLVYDYIPNGTLADHLHGSNRKVAGLCWQTRVDIALQVAMAVEYLHFMVEPPVVHRDITTMNIFVDQNMRVRVGDFGLSRLLVLSENRSLSGELSGSSSGCVWTGPQGTPGYLDPDYYKSFRLTEKSDVYSFGVVLLELISGLKAVDQRREKRELALVDMVVAKIQLGLLDQVVDPVLVAEGTTVAESVAAVAELAFRCVAADKDDRPDATEVVGELRRIWGRTRGVKGSNANVVVVPAGSET